MVWEEEGLVGVGHVVHFNLYAQKVFTEQSNYLLHVVAFDVEVYPVSELYYWCFLLEFYYN